MHACVSQNCQSQVAELLQIGEILEKSKTEQDMATVTHSSKTAHKLPDTEQHCSAPEKRSSFFPHSSLSIYSLNPSFEEVNEGYMEGSLPIVDPRVVLLGCEGSGKTSLIDTFIGKSFQDTPAIEGADQMEINVKTAANWELMSEEQKILDLKKQALLETEFFLSLKECCHSLPSMQSTAVQPPTPSNTTPTSALPTNKKITSHLHISSSI